MPLLTIRASGIEAMQMRLQALRERLPQVMLAAAQQIAQEAAQALSDAAPAGKGEGEGEPPEGDGPGRLKESFQVESEGAGFPFVVRVVTTQPRKLNWVREGRGPVAPLHPAYALFWPGLDHPVMSARPSAANDFVTPVLQAARDGAGEIVQAALAEAMAGE